MLSLRAIPRASLLAAPRPARSSRVHSFHPRTLLTSNLRGPARHFNSSRPALEGAGFVNKAKHAYKNSSSSTRQLMAQFGVAAIAGLIYGVISSLRGKPLIQNEASAKHPEVAEPVTQVTFPTKLQLASDGGQYQLVALGPRCVTFLRFTAYAIALYFHKEDLDALLADKAWKDLFQSERFLSDGAFSEECVEELLRRNVRFCLTIVPVKSSSGSHIKGGITRSLEAQLKAQSADNRLTPADAKAVEEALRYFGHTFPKASLPIYAHLDFVREVSQDSRSSSHLRVIDQGTDKGTVNHPWIADNLLRVYLSGLKSVSPPLRESFAESMQHRFPE